MDGRRHHLKAGKSQGEAYIILLQKLKKEEKGEKM